MGPDIATFHGEISVNGRCRDRRMRPITWGCAALLALLLTLPAGCAERTGSVIAASPKAPLFDGMGAHRRTVTTDAPLAQRYFDQGLVWAYGFNHDEAIRSFEAATDADPTCAMAWWGIALCNGPHINNPLMTPEQSERAWEALQHAVSVKDRAGRTERALIEALEKRYAAPPVTDRRPLDEAYAAAMEQVWRDNPRDADIGTLYAESLMDLQPWDLWTKDGRPKGRTEEIVAVLESVLRLDPNHPGANHLYIHAVEASGLPQRGTAAADRLRNAVPASGHLLHMPTHIDVLTGQWEKAVASNQRAMRADEAYRARSPRQGFYHVYMSHNGHMLSFAAMMQGRRELALQAARDFIAAIPEDYVREQSALADPVMCTPLQVMMRFGRWDDILAEPAPPDYLPVTTAMWRFTRGVAFAAKGQVAEAEYEQTRFREQVEAVPQDTMLFINRAQDVLAIADHVLTGEIAYRRRDIDVAVRELREAVRLEDELKYMEPPEWIQPVRHTLGAILVEAGRYDEAEQVYREDLKDWPDNGWSLYGLARCLESRGLRQEAADTQRRFEAVWAKADTKIGASCLCVRGGA